MQREQQQQLEVGNGIVAKLGMITSLLLLSWQPRYPCHIIALAEYRARLECATLLRIAAAAAVDGDANADASFATRSLWLLCTRSACGVAKDNALARHLVTVLPPPYPLRPLRHSPLVRATRVCVCVCVLASVCAQVAKGLRPCWLLATSCGICFSFFFPPLSRSLFLSYCCCATSSC